MNGPDKNHGSSSAMDPNDAERWPGTYVMGTPAVPTWDQGLATDEQRRRQQQREYTTYDQNQNQNQNHNHPYTQNAPVDKNSPLDSVLKKFNSWTAKAESTANNIWNNLKTGPSTSETAWGKLNLRAKTITGGGFEALYKESFGIYPNEVLKKTFACYLSTSTGPVAGTLYLSNVHVAFCSDRPLSSTSPSGLQAWSYYKILLPLAKIGSINPVVIRENATERYLQLITIDGHEFWLMGFVNYEKACHHLFDSLSSFAAPGIPVASQTYQSA